MFIPDIRQRLPHMQTAQLAHAKSAPGTLIKQQERRMRYPQAEEGIAIECLAFKARKEDLSVRARRATPQAPTLDPASEEAGSKARQPEWAGGRRFACPDTAGESPAPPTGSR